MKSFLKSDNAPSAIGPYSQAIGFNDLIFTSGQIGLDASGNFVSEDIQEQTLQVIKNLTAILEENGSSLKNVIKTTVFLTTMEDFVPMNEIYSELFGSSMPARSTVAVAGLPKNGKIEIEVIAFKNK
ncbi:RidA family protein [soil metagenome]